MVDWALDTLIWDYLNSSIHLAPYLEEKFRRIYVGDAYKFYRQRYSACSLTYGPNTESLVVTRSFSIMLWTLRRAPVTSLVP